MTNQWYRYKIQYNYLYQLVTLSYKRYMHWFQLKNGKSFDSFAIDLTPTQYISLCIWNNNLFDIFDTLVHKRYLQFLCHWNSNVSFNVFHVWVFKVILRLKFAKMCQRSCLAFVGIEHCVSAWNMIQFNQTPVSILTTNCLFIEF